jgi:hypothetical protein
LVFQQHEDNENRREETVEARSRVLRVYWKPFQLS